MKYDHKIIESKWQKIWGKTELYKTSGSKDKEKYYVLDMFPYPSGAGLHVGHPKGFIAADVVARLKMMQGYNVLHPMGWDAFGLPAENYALKNKIHPRVATEKNVAIFKAQLEKLGFTYDWLREINTTDPEFYKWTQWTFLQMFKRGLAYESNEPIIWCPSCLTGLAMEDLENGKCERCGSEVERKPMRQWVLKITDYAERLLNDLEKLPQWEESIKEMQKNWIGRSEGATVKFQISNSKFQINSKNQIPNPKFPKNLKDLKNFTIEVFTTRPDTLFGCTYMVVAPEHPLIENLKSEIKNYDEVYKYIVQSKKKSDLERTDLAKEKTGVKIEGLAAINPVNNEEIPIFVADYVLAGYGTGAIMAVPAHDERDFEFAKKYNLPIREVVQTTDDKRRTTAKKCVIIHGSPSEDRTKEPEYISDNVKHWLMWLKNELEKNNFTVFNPQMPTPWKPDYDEWKRQIEKLDIDENTVIVGHSAGGAFAVRWLGESKRKIDKLILVAAGLQKTEDNERLHQLYDFKIDKSIKNRVNEVIIFISNEKKGYKIENSKIYANELNEKFIYLENRGHFTISYNPNNNKFQELLNVILKNQAKLPFSGEGVNINSDFLNGLETKKAKKKMIEWLEEKGAGKRAVNYKLKDWVFSRQRYWGEPIPLVFCEQCAKEGNNNVLILHGWEGDSKSDFISSLKDNLTAKGYNVLALDLPNTDEPDFDVWYDFAEDEIKKKNLSNFILIGHSMGGLLALKLAEKHKIKKLVLVAPVGPKSSEKYFNQFTDKLSPDELKIFKNYQNRKINVQKIKENAEIINFLFGGKDPWITEEVRNFYIENFKDKAVIQILKGAGHMCEDEIVKELKPLESIFNKYSQTEAGWHPLADDELPLTLPEVERYEPSGTGESPLANMPKWVNVKCPKCNWPAKRETNTMPQWAGSSWYYLRYIDSHNDKALVDKEKEKYWSPVDLYVGGAEHATRHLIYARFWHKFLYDIGVVNYDEPFTRLRYVGLILAEDGRKMSKRWGNVVNPDEVVEKYGADAMRVYEMFMGPFAQTVAWSENGLKGGRNFLEKVWRLSRNAERITRNAADSKNINSLLHKTIKKVGEDIMEFKFNTAISAMMILVNEMSAQEKTSLENYEALLKILSPFAPHIAEELWQESGHTNSIFKEDWPKYDPELAKEERINLVLQINGKLRDTVEVGIDVSEEEAKKIALENGKIKKWIAGKEIVKVIFVRGKLVNIVVK